MPELRVGACGVKGERERGSAVARRQLGGVRGLANFGGEFIGSFAVADIEETAPGIETGERGVPPEPTARG